MTNKTLDTLVDDIYGLFEQKGGFDAALFETFGENIVELMNHRFNTVRGDATLRMSNIGKPDRQLWMEINRPQEKETIPAPTMIKFSYGDLIEQMILMYAKMAGHTVEKEQEEIVVDGIKGHIDAVIDGVVVDVKSASSFSWQKFDSGALLLEGNDPFGYVAQLAGYVEAISPGSDGAFIAVDKTLGKITVLRVPSEVLKKYNVRNRIEHAKKLVVQPEAPEKCYSDIPDGKSGNRKLSTGCSYCGFKSSCWPNLRTYYYSTGPRYLTTVVREPQVKEFPSEI